MRIFSTWAIVLLVISAAGLAVVDLGLAAGATCGVVVGLAIVGLRRVKSGVPDLEAAKETTVGLYSSQDVDGLCEEERYFKPIRLVTAKYMGLEEGWEETEALLAGR